MITKVLLLALVSSTFAESANGNAQQQQQRSPRAPQGQIRYSDPDGSKVDWKLYTPQAHRQIDSSARRPQRAETGTAQANFQNHRQVVQAPIEPQPQYQPWSAVPSHIKQLISEAYTLQGPYVDPGAFFYQAPAIPVDPSTSSSASQHDRAFSPSPDHSYFNSAVNYRAAGYDQSGSGKLGGIKYADEDRVHQRSAELPYGAVLPTQSPTKRQYQPYKQIQVSQTQSQHQTQSQYQTQSQFKQQVAQRQPQLQYQSPQSQFKQQVAQRQPQLQYQSPQSQYRQSEKQVPQSQYPQSQYRQSDKQATQYQHYQRLDKQNSQSQLRYPQIDGQNSQNQPLKNMPNAIQTLLSYQAQLPYNVIADRILYRPKHLFVPKPLPEDTKYVGQYPSKVYFVKVDGDVYEGPTTTQDQLKTEKRY